MNNNLWSMTKSSKMGIKNRFSGTRWAVGHTAGALLEDQGL